MDEEKKSPRTEPLQPAGLFCFDSIPQDIVSDRGSRPKRGWALCQAEPPPALLQEHQSIRKVEGANHDLGSALCCYPSSWRYFLPEVEYTHNFPNSSATDVCPFMITMG